MRRAVLLALALLTPLGCASPPRREVVARYHPDSPLEEAKAEGGRTYGLYLTGQPRDMPPLFQSASSGGTTVGFRRDVDGVVMAVARNQAVPAPDDPCEWRVIPGRGRARAEKFADATEKVTAGVCGVLLVTGLIVAGLGLAVLYGMGKGNSNNGRLGAW